MKYPIKAFSLFYLNRKEEGKLKAADVFIEFDAIAWGLDAGLEITFLNGTEV